MANVDNAIGFIPVRLKGGGCDIRLGQYTIADGYTTALGRGDPVQMTGTGKNIEKAEAGNVDNIGVFAGCRYTDTAGNIVWSDYWPASQSTQGSVGAVALVYDDPQIVFQIQCDTLAAGDVGALADWDSGTPSSTTRLSGTELVASSTGTSGKSIRILGLAPIQDNAYGTYAKAEVCFVEHVLLTGAAGAGGV